NEGKHGNCPSARRRWTPCVGPSDPAVCLPENRPLTALRRRQTVIPRRPTPTRRQLIATAVALALLGTAFLLWQRYAPRAITVTAGKFPEELVYVRSNDDVINAGAIFTPPKSLARPVAVIWIHGWGVNFYYPTYVMIGRALAERGYTCITANTRMHDIGNVAGYQDGKRLRGGGYWGVPSEAVRDIAAWIDFAGDRGFDKVILVGHSA